MAEVIVGLVQTDAGADKRTNVEAAIRGVEEAADRGAQWVALPENFHIRGGAGHDEAKVRAAEPIPGPTSEALAETARRLGIHLLAGSIGETTGDKDKIFNTSLLIGPDGRTLAAYRKLHLFDVTIGDHVVAKESARVTPGSEIVVADTPIGRVGLSICYDLRFPELYRSLALRGAVVAFVPANFTLYTGRDHWETLLRARAIENGMFVVAPAQIGPVPDGHQTYGRSMVVDPWGVVVACAPDRAGVTLARLELASVPATRSRIPSLTHRRPEVYDR